MKLQAIKTYLAFVGIAIAVALGIGTTVFGSRLVLQPKQGVQGHASMSFISGVCPSSRRPEDVPTSRNTTNTYSGPIYVFTGHSISYKNNLKNASIVATVTDGNFHIALEPGDYSLVLPGDDMPPMETTVTPGNWTQKDISGTIMGM